MILFVSEYAEEYLNGRTWENELDQFVKARNAAAHGFTADFLGSEELTRYADFINRLGTAVIERVRWEALSRHIEVASGRAELLGVVRHQFAARRAGRCRMRACTIRVTDTVYFLHERSCPATRILGLRDQTEIDHQELPPANGQRIGIRFSRIPPVNIRIVRVAP